MQGRAFAGAQEQRVAGLRPAQQAFGERMQEGVEGLVAMGGAHPRSVARPSTGSDQALVRGPRPNCPRSAAKPQLASTHSAS